MIKLFGIRHFARGFCKQSQFQQNVVLSERISKLERNFERMERERIIEGRMNIAANVTVVSAFIGVYLYSRKQI